MRVAVAGKGGAGKTTISTTLEILAGHTNTGPDGVAPVGQQGPLPRRLRGDSRGLRLSRPRADG
jgi:hypothetical protein